MEKLQKSKIAIVGCGGLGSLAAAYLAAAGVGAITLIDGDVVDESNLQRQITFGKYIGFKKSDALKEYLNELNYSVDVKSINEYLSIENVSDLLHGHDVILDGTDHIPTKMVINDWAKQYQIPMVYAAVRKYEGYLATFTYQNELDLTSIYPIGTEQIDTCDSAGVFGPAVGTLALYQATEVMKLITGFAQPLTGEMLWMDLKTYLSRKIKLQVNNDLNTEKMNDSMAQKEVKPVTTLHLSELKPDQVLVSILEDYEIFSLREDVIHMPLTTFDLEQLDEDQEYVFYCMSGKRSWALVDRIQRISNQFKVFSLEGGASLYTEEDC